MSDTYVMLSICIMLQAMQPNLFIGLDVENSRLRLDEIHLGKHDVGASRTGKLFVGSIQSLIPR
jgi:hypothetical protein